MFHMISDFIFVLCLVRNVHVSVRNVHVSVRYVHGSVLSIFDHLKSLNTKMTTKYADGNSDINKTIKTTCTDSLPLKKDQTI